MDLDVVRDTRGQAAAAGPGLDGRRVRPLGERVKQHTVGGDVLNLDAAADTPDSGGLVGNPRRSGRSARVFRFRVNVKVELVDCVARPGLLRRQVNRVLAIALNLVNNSDEEIKVRMSMAKLDRFDAPNYLRLCELYIEKKDLDQAELMKNRVLEIAPNSDLSLQVVALFGEN